MEGVMERDNQKLCFVIMPYGKRLDIGDQTEVNFDDVYEFIIKEVVQDRLQMQVIRSDKISNPGWIHRDMLEHIYSADVAIVDITTLNPNVFYELGVRHALRRSVTILIKRRRTNIPFNIQGQRIIQYDMDVKSAREAQKEIEEFIRNGLEKQHDDSTVYEVFPDLQVMREGDQI